MTMSHQVALPEVVTQIAAVDRVYVRMALTRDDSGRLGVRSLLVDVFPQVWLDNPDNILASWLSARFRYEYSHAILLSEFVRSKQVREWFGGGECQLANFDMRPGYGSRVLTFDMLGLHSVATAIRHFSYGRDGFVAMPWPHTTFACAIKDVTNPMRNGDYDPLVAPAAEYFESFQAARAEVVHGVSDPTQIFNFQDEVVVRVVHADGWLNEVRIGRNELTTVVHGIKLAGSRVVLAGSPQVRRQRDVHAPGAVTVPIPSDLPQRLTIALTRGSEELDRASYMPGFPGYMGTSQQVVVENVRLVPASAVLAEEPAAADAPEQVVVLDTPDAEPLAPEEHPKVFISYSHDTAQQARQVLAFANRLRQDGVDCSIDRYEESPAQGWPQWMEDQIEWAEFVLVVCTQQYTKRFRGKEVPGKGLGATWEGAILTQQLYDQAAKNSTIIPIVFSPEDVAHIPTVLKGATHYNVTEGPRYTELYRRLTNQPLIVKPPLGNIKRLSPRGDEAD